jgi:tetratricopeptide (TPR) repeat protein
MVSPSIPRLLALLTVTALGLLHAPAFADVDSESMPERTLKQIVAKQKTLLEDAAKQGDKLDEESLRDQLQGLSHEYELLLHDSPNFAAAYVAYGLLLGKIDMRKEAMAMLLKANQLDPDIPLVKNQLGNYLAEQGKPLEAVNYFFSAIKLEPKEPLYHYELGKLLYEGRDDFLKSGVYTREKLDDAMLEAFRRAAELAPDRLEFTYRYAESYYDLAKPDWDGALKVWASLEEKAQSPLERQTMRLQAANVLIKDGRTDPARFLLTTVTEPTLAAQKQKLVAQLPENAKK